ncbi:MAG: flippase [Patescibacteria group bacterium]|nr:flippase [Patescibacteria group bacterium]
MSIKRSIAGNTAFQMGGKVVATGLGLLTVGIMTRYLGTDGYGQFIIVLTFLQFFAIAAGFGLPLTMTRLISREGADERRLVSNIFAMRLVSGLVIFAAAPLVALAFPYPHAVKIGIAVGTFSFLALALSETIKGIMQKHLTTWKSSISEMTSRLIMFGCVAGAVASGFGLLAFVAALAVSNVVQFAMTYAFARKHGPIGLKFERPVWKKTLIETWPIGVSILFNLIYLKGDIVIMSVMRTQSEVGLYGAAYKVLDVITVVPYIFMGLALPLLTRAWSNDDFAGFRRKLSMSFDFLAMIAVPLLFGGIAVSSDLMALIAGEDFRASGIYVAILMVGALAVYWQSLYAHAFVAMGRQRDFIWIYAANAALSLALYIVLIGRYGGLGAAAVTALGELFVATATTVLVTRMTKFRPNLVRLSKIMIACTAMFAVLILVPQLHVLLRVVLGAATYSVALLALGGVPMEAVRSVLARPNDKN